MLQVCKQLFEKWNSNVRYCHWKSNEHLMQGLDGKTDLDVFVMPEDKSIAEAHLSSCEYIKFVPQKGCRYPNVDEWIGFDHETGALVHVHLHYQIITGTKFVKEYVFPLNEEIIATRIQDKETGVYVTHPELEAIILFCRIALKSKDKKNIKPSKDSQREIDYIKQRIEIKSLLELSERLLGNPSGTKLCDVILMENPGKTDWNKVYNIADDWLKPYKKYGKFSSWVKHNYNFLRLGIKTKLNKSYDCTYATKKTLPVKGISVCFIGADGSGKSTVTKELCEWLTWKIDAKRFYLGSGDGYKSIVQRLLLKLRKKSSISNAGKKKSDKQITPPKPSFKAKIGVAMLSSESLRIAKRARKQAYRATQYAQKGSVALMDRFPQIQFAGVYDGPKIEDLARRKGGESFITRYRAKKEILHLSKAQNYQPNVVFKLLLSPDESMRRKPFEDRESVIRKAAITPQLTFEHSVVYDIDATQDYQLEILQIKRLIWKLLLEAQS